MRSLLFPLLPVLLVACAKTVEPVPAPTPEPAPAPAPAAKAPVLDPVYFDTGSASVQGSQTSVIDQAAEVMRTSTWSVIVLGLADATGDPQANRVLSLQRAEAVAALLRSKVSIPENRITVHAIGERLATGATVAERKVEFVFYEDHGLPMRDVVMQSGVLTEDFRKKATQ